MPDGPAPMMIALMLCFEGDIFETIFKIAELSRR
jgi:hypothetical protein